MSDGSHRSPVTERVRKRASEACTFCRGRKIKCSTERPTCANCKTYGKTCVYAPIQQTQGSRPPKKPRTEPAMTPASVSTSSEPADQPQRSVSRIVVSANGMSSYHGRTSALFEETSLERPVVEHWSKVSEDWVEKGLVAEAARQRQLEQFNFRQGKLDFDGVDPELGMHLLELHWNRQHHSFLLTYRPAFMRDMACAGPYFSKILLNAIYFGASKFSPRLDVRRDPNDVRTAGAVFRERVRELLGSALDKSEVTTIQALLVMTNSLFALGDERSAAWIYAGLAFRMIIDLGMHVDAPGLGGARRFTDEDLEIRRRVFWGAYVVDKIQSLYQGRPVTLTESDTFVPIKFLDSFEEFESWTPFAFSPEAASSHAGCASYSISTFQYLCRLSIILGNILSSIYNERSSEKAPSDLSSLLETLHEKLMAWKDSLPAHLKIDLKGAIAVPPNVMSLWALYNVLIILLHRPFVADGHLHSTARSISVNSFVACATAATTIVKILRAYHLAFSVQRAPYLISYATYVAATVHSRIASKRGPGSDAHQSLETCLAVFRENQETNFAVRRADAIVRSLIKRLDVAMPVTEALRIHRDVENPQNTSSPQTNRSGPTSPNDPIFQNLDIDGVIQSFARDQDMMNNPHGTTGEQMGFAVPVPTQADMYRSIHGDHHIPNWPAAEYHGIQDEATFTVDDLLYGFNGELLDSFLGTEWGTT